MPMARSIRVIHTRILRLNLKRSMSMPVVSCSPADKRAQWYFTPNPKGIIITLASTDTDTHTHTHMVMDTKNDPEV